MRCYILIIGLLSTNPTFSQEIKKIDWSSDIEFLKKELPGKHVNLFSEKSKAEFNLGLESIKSAQSNLTEFGVAVKLQQLISKFGDSHTNIGWEQLIDKNKILPLQLYWFSDGIYILQTVKENQEILGTKIIAINQISIDVVVDSLSTLITIDNKAIVKSRIPMLIPNVQLLEHFKFVDNGNIILETEDLTGKIARYEIQPALMDGKNRVKFRIDSLAFCYRNQRELFADKYFENEKVYYVQYNKCMGRENPPPNFRGKSKKLPSFIDFKNKVLETVSNEPINKLIVDLRFNNGGNSLQGTDFIRELSALENVNQKGKLFVILGRSTFSSAIINAMDFREMTPAIFVGEETSGKPNHYGEVRTFKLPNSGMMVGYSTKFFKRTNKNLKTIAPDVVVESNFEQYKQGIDPVFEWIKKQ